MIRYEASIRIIQKYVDSKRKKKNNRKKKKKKEKGKQVKLLRIK